MMRLIDGYILQRVSMPLLAAVGIAMAALLMQRLIILLDLFANRGSPLSMILQMLGNLVPFYLGLALPAALFIGVLYAGNRTPYPLERKREAVSVADLEAEFVL